MNLLLFVIALAIVVVSGTALEAGTHNITLIDTSITRVGFDGPGKGLIIASITGTCICFTFVWNRIHWRFRLSGGLGYDDWAIGIAWVRLLC